MLEYHECGSVVRNINVIMIFLCIAWESKHRQAGGSSLTSQAEIRTRYKLQNKKYGIVPKDTVLSLGTVPYFSG
jgi:hypothetical protein